MWGRQTYAGVSTPWGVATFGRQYSPYFFYLSVLDPFFNYLAGGAGNLEIANARINNVALYATPTVGGFAGEAMYAFGEQVGSTKAGSQWSLSAHYGDFIKDKLWVGYAHNEVNNTVGTTAPISTNVTGKLDLVGASYNFGPVRLIGNYLRTRKVDPTVLPVATPLATASADNWLIGLSLPVGGAGKLLASYIHHNDKAPANRDASQYGIGYLHTVNRSVTLFSSYGRIRNKNGSTFTVGNTTDRGIGETQFNIGFDYRFVEGPRGP